MTPHEFLDHMMSLSARFCFRVSSSYRSMYWNGHKSIKGHTESRHQFWLANDVVLDPGEKKAAFIKECRRKGLYAKDEGDHLHVQGG